MITCEQLYQALIKNDLTFFTGVPDSTFKEWLLYLEHQPNLKHVLANNEGTAIATAIGYHLATNKIPVVYMQNSGLGNAVNPITSLADTQVYSIPMILFIGWRGRPEEKDEPQHKKMGRITLPILDTLEIFYGILPDAPGELDHFWQNTYKRTLEKQSPYAVIVPKKTFEKYEKPGRENPWKLTREDAIKTIVDHLQGSEIIVGTTGKPSRELYEYRDHLQQDHSKDFYTVGGLGCASSIALAIALEKPQKKVLAFDADGAALMHLGSWATVGYHQAKNFKHIVFDNEAHESTGAQPSHSEMVDFVQIALACGYKSAQIIKDQEQLLQNIDAFLQSDGPDMLVIKTKASSRSDLGRPKTTPIENKSAFMKNLS